MPAAPSSKDKPSKLSAFHIAVSSFAALAGVAIAAWQALGPSSPPAPPAVNVTVAIDPAKASQTQQASVAPAPKGDAEAAAAADGEVTYSAALNDGADQRYRFADLFDGRPETSIALAAPDQEINILVTFNNSTSSTISGFEYQPPPNADPDQLAKVADVMVLPEGQISAAGQPVTSFPLPASQGRQSFALPVPAAGKGLWLRIAGGTQIGDFKILRTP